MCVIFHRALTSTRSVRWSDRLVSRPVSERGSGRCRRPVQNRPKRSTGKGSSTRGRRPSSISKLSCLIWWDDLQLFYFSVKLAAMLENTCIIFERPNLFLSSPITFHFFDLIRKNRKIQLIHWNTESVFNVFVYSFLPQVRSSDATWSDTRRNLRKDHRWESASLLEREEKEKLFNEHVEALAKKKKEHFRQLLDETSMVRSVNTKWKKAVSKL